MSIDGPKLNRIHDSYGDGPRGTPTVDGDFLYAEGGNGDVTCVDVQTGKESGTVPVLSLEDAIGRLEKEMIIDALKNTRGNVTAAAEILKTTVRKFAYKAQKYGVDYKLYR